MEKLQVTKLAKVVSIKRTSDYFDNGIIKVMSNLGPSDDCKYNYSDFVLDVHVKDATKFQINQIVEIEMGSSWDEKVQMKEALE